MLESMTGHLRNISERPNLSLELVILVIKVKNITFIAKMAVWHETGICPMIESTGALWKEHF